jgi:branched-chain amino acid transport system ATP-binding protein
LGAIFVLTVFYAPHGVIGWFARNSKNTEPDPKEPDRDGTPRSFDIGIIPTQRQASADQATPDLALDGIVKNFGGMRAVNDVSLKVNPGDRIAILGPNGAGKTSLFHLISGALKPTSGKVFLFGRDVSRLRVDKRVAMGLGRTFQITNLFATLSVIDNLRLALISYHSKKFLMHRPAAALNEITAEARKLLDAIGLWQVRNDEVRHLSYGHQRQLEVIMAVALRPRLLLLDEPTAGLSVAEESSIIDLIHAVDPSITMLIIEHDMDVAFAVADTIMVFHHGEKLAEGTTEEIRKNPEVQRIYLGAAAD